VTSAAIAKRLAEIEAAVDALAPRPSELDAFKMKYPFVDWLTTDELMTLDELMRAADVETIGDLGEADQARASAIYYAAEARRLSGAPNAEYKRRRAAEAKGR
jgi:hypothetical protein